MIRRIFPHFRTALSGRVAEGTFAAKTLLTDSAPMEQQKLMGEGMVLAPTPGPRVMRRAIHCSLSLPSEHGAHRRRLHSSASGERATGARIQAAEPAANGSPHRENRVGLEAVAVFSPLRNEPEHPKNRRPNLSRFVRLVGFPGGMALSANGRGQPLPQTKASANKPASLAWTTIGAKKVYSQRSATMGSTSVARRAGM